MDGLASPSNSGSSLACSTPQQLLLLDATVTNPYGNLPLPGYEAECDYQNLPLKLPTNVGPTMQLPLPRTEKTPIKQPRPRSCNYENVHQTEAESKHTNSPASTGGGKDEHKVKHLQVVGDVISSSSRPQKKTHSKGTRDLIERNRTLLLQSNDAKRELAQTKQEIQALSSELDIAKCELKQEREFNQGFTEKDRHDLIEKNRILSEKLSKALSDLQTFKDNQPPQNEQVDSSEQELKDKILELQESNQSLSQDLARTRRQLTIAQNNQRLTQKPTQNTTISELSQHQATKDEQLAQDIESWKVSRSKLTTEEEIARGAWGKVSTGKVEVAVKQLHEVISCKETITKLRREIFMLSQVRHPNLVQFMGVVFDEQAENCQLPAFIITELLDTNLRSAYQQNKLDKKHKLSIFKDVAKALKYLHEFKDPIIHRDVSAPNVLLEALPDENWKGKLTDLGSANFAEVAQTLAEGAIVYAAPETFPASPNQQTPKIDVYSYGVMLCEVTTDCLPEIAKFKGLLAEVSKTCLQMHALIELCTIEEYSKRPDMGTVLGRLDKM